METITNDEEVTIGAEEDHVLRREMEIPLFARMIDGRNQTSVRTRTMGVNGKVTEFEEDQKVNRHQKSNQ